MTFEKFSHVSDRVRLSRLYLQKHPLDQWATHGLAAEATPRPHEHLAPWLHLEHELLWLSAEGLCTHAALHYDEHENLHAVVAGSKRFELWHPAYGKAVFGDGSRKMRSLHYLWGWDDEEAREYMHALNPMATTPGHQPFSPVRPMPLPSNVRLPMAKGLNDGKIAPEEPSHANAPKRLVCDVSAGDVLFLPSFWWHTVDAAPAASGVSGEHAEVGAATRSARAGGAGTCGFTASINYFFTPFFRKGTDMRHFMHEPLYNFMRSSQDVERMDEHSATAPDRWRRPRWKAEKDET